jgi:autotransporter-associated beta strand protein
MLRIWWRRSIPRPARRSKCSRILAAHGLSGRLEIEPLENRLAPATHTWTGAANNLWSNNGNWIGGAPVSSEANVVLIFPTVPANTTNINDIAGLTIQSITFSGNGYAMSGSAITLIGGLAADANVTSGDTINLDTALGGTQTWTVATAGATLAVGGVVSGPATSNLTLAGPGSVVLSAANSYAGVTTLSGGTLTVGSNTALGTGMLVLSGGSLQSSGGVTLANPFTLGGPATLGGSNNLTLSGAGNLGGGNSLKVINAGTTTFSGILSGAGNLDESAGAGTFVLSGANTYIGMTVLASGILMVGNNSALGTGTLSLDGGTIQSSASVTLASAFTVSGAVMIGGSNNLAFTGAGSLGSGTTLTIGNAGTTTFSGILSGGGAITEASAGGSLVLSGASAYTGMTTLASGILVVGNSSALGQGSLALAGGTLQANAALSLANTFTVAGPPMIGGSNTITFTGAGMLSDGATLTVTNTGSTIFSGVLDGAGALTEGTGTGTVVLNGGNTYSGNTTLSSGTLIVGKDNALGSGMLIWSSGTLQANVPVKLANPFSVSGPANGPSPPTIGGSTNITFTGQGTIAAANTLTVRNTATTTFTNALSDAGMVAESGTGTLVLSGSNTFTGGVTLSAGTIIVGDALALGAGPLVFTGGGLQANSPLTLANPFTIGVNASGTVGGSNDLTFTGSGTLSSGSILIVNNSGTTTFTGALGGAGGLTAGAGSGTLLLSAGNAYAGATTVNGGTLRQGAANTIPGSSAVTVAPGAVLDLNDFNGTIGSLAGGGNVTLGTATLTTGGNNGSTTFGGDISGSGGLTIVGNGSFTLSGTNDYTGPTLIMTGTLLVDGSQPSSNVTVNGGAVLGGSGSVGMITAAGSISPGGPGTGFLKCSNAAFNSGSSLTVKLNATIAGTGYNQLKVNGTVSLNGATLTGTTGFMSSSGDTFMIILSTGGITGTFMGLPNGSVIALSNQFFSINYSANNVILSRSKILPNAALTSSANPVIVGFPVTFTLTANAIIAGAGTPTGTVMIRDGATPLGTATLNSSGMATLSTSSLSLGSHMISAVYSGDSNYSITSATLTENVIMSLVPAITSLSQTVVPEGSPDLTLTIGGSNLIPNSIVRLDTVPVNTVFVSSTQLQATVSAAALSDEATFTVTVFNPGFGGGASNGLTLSVSEALLPDGTRGTPNQRVVAELYSDLLGRTVDSAGLAGWSTFLDQGGTVAQVAAGITSGLEYQTNLVQQLYRRYLQRAADPAGLAGSLTFLRSGGTGAQLAAALAGSQEYFQVRGGGTNNGFLQALYQNTLNRALDAAGQASFNQLMASGMSAIQVASVIFSSDEYRSDLVQNFYQRFLDRATDSSGLVNWLSMLQNGATDEQVIVGFMGSREYFNKTAI